MNPNKELWEKGDFTRIAETMRESGEALMQRLGITDSKVFQHHLALLKQHQPIRLSR